ncbi:MAG: DUF4127 family protein [Clostridia bacterium]|nr:DUF4127 family protein [Clostridia bacterium]
MRVVCLPLDSRPCNLLFPQQLARWCGDVCAVPDASEMDDFTRPASFESTRAFLERELPGADAAVISIDRLCFGSLLASREESVSESEALGRLAWLAKLSESWPRIPFYAFSVIIRASISALASGDLDSYHAMADYSAWSDIADETGDAEARRRAREARERVPAAILRKYHAVRARNHAVNRRCVELARTGVFDSLELLMEDAPPHGFHRREQRELLRLTGGDSRVSLRNGADEGGAIGVMKAALRGEPVDAEVIWLGCPEGDFIARYEDRPFRENLDRALAYAGVRATPGATRALVIACPPDGRQGECGETNAPEGTPPIARAVDALIAAGKQVYLLDLLGANGGSFALMERVAAPRLCGYSAWNTASNALGTIVAQLVSDAKAGKANIAFRNERILDDLFYESRVRQALNEKLRALGEDPYRLADKPNAERMLREEYAALKHPLLDMVGPYAVSLPWSRTFEALVETFS